MFIHPSSTSHSEIWTYHVTLVTEHRSRMCDTHVVNMVRKASKKAFLEPGDTR